MWNLKCQNLKPTEAVFTEEVPAFVQIFREGSLGRKGLGFLEKAGPLCTLIGQFIETSQGNQIFAFTFLSEYGL